MCLFVLMSSEELYKWMAENSVKPKEMAPKLGLSVRTLSGYKSKGMPEAKSILAEKVTREWFTDTPLTTLPDANIIQCKMEGNRKEVWTAADLIEDGELTEYAKKRLDRIASLVNEAIKQSPERK